MKYIDYKNAKDFYNIDETCRLFEMDKQELRAYSEKYGIEPVEDQFGNWGFPRKLFCKLHNHIYKEQRGQTWNGPMFQNGSRGPWA